MSVFLIITSLSLAFYLGLLAFLYRDSHKRRRVEGSVYRVQSGSVAELGPLPAVIYRGPSSHRQHAATVLVRFAKSSSYGKRKPQIVQSEPAKVIPLPILARDNRDAQCG
jgi:hypothetical protein